MALDLGLILETNGLTLNQGGKRLHDSRYCKEMTDDEF